MPESQPRTDAHDADEPLQVRFLPSGAADPYSVRGMISRLTEDAAPREVAAILEEVNGALVGALPELTELVAAAADWARVRLTWDEPHHTTTFETWTRLTTAHGMLQNVKEQLESAEDWVAACPAEQTDAPFQQWVNVLRTRDLLDDVMGAPAPPGQPTVRDPQVDRQRAAVASSPQAGSRRPSPPAGSTPPPVATRPAGPKR